MDDDFIPAFLSLQNSQRLIPFNLKNRIIQAIKNLEAKDFIFEKFKQLMICMNGPFIPPELW